MGPPPHGTPGWELPTLCSAHPASRGLGTGKRQGFGARRGPAGRQGSQGGDPSARALLASHPRAAAHAGCHRQDTETRLVVGGRCQPSPGTGKSPCEARQLGLF